MLQITKRSTLLIVVPQEPVTLPHAITLMQDLEATLATPRIRTLVLNLAEVKEADGAGLGVLVKTSTAARAAGQEFYLYQPSEEVLKALKEEEIDGFFPILDYEEDLLAHIPD
jgi:anti-anti-sigma factor